MALIPPIIKWTGSKRHVAAEIVSHFPDEIETYYEPFLGGGSVFAALVLSGKRVNKFVLSDINSDLIDLWKTIKDRPLLLLCEYERRWAGLKSFKSYAAQKEYYNKIREKFNRFKDTYDFFFLNRTCFNGLIRYNSHGEFNSAFHYERSGISPENLSAVIDRWNKILSNISLEFVCQKYDEIHPSLADFCFFDPPYPETNSMYFGNFDQDEFWKFVGNVPCKYSLTYKREMGVHCKQHFLIGGGNSSFKRLAKSESKVYESLYLNY